MLRLFDKLSHGKAPTMPSRFATAGRVLLFLLLPFAAANVRNANAATCSTQSQMTAAQRDSLATSARAIAALLQTGDIEALRGNTIPAVAADFGGVTASVKNLQPLVQSATVTVEELYLLDSSTDSAGASQIDFYCGQPVVVLNFNGLPPGNYALTILHATGVPQPQQISLLFSRTADNRWMLAGFFTKPMIAAGHDGLWYWTSARKYAQEKMDWNAWLYYRMASNLLDPLSFLSSANLEKLQHESDQIRPNNFPGASPIALNAYGASFTVSAIDTTDTFGGLDLDVQYTPDATQAAQLQDPPSARKQVTAIMSALVELHPELQTAFHGIWVHANQGTASLFALELPMNDIVANPLPPSASANPVAR
jgi:hypothetical protein